MNGGGYSNPLLDRILEDSAGRRSVPRRVDRLREATALVHADRPILALCRPNDLYAFSERLDFRPEPHQQFQVLVWRMRWKD
jgi:hypothetical protein